MILNIKDTGDKSLMAEMGMIQRCHNAILLRVVIPLGHLQLSDCTDMLLKVKTLYEISFSL